MHYPPQKYSKSPTAAFFIRAREKPRPWSYIYSENSDALFRALNTSCPHLCWPYVAREFINMLESVSHGREKMVPLPMLIASSVSAPVSALNNASLCFSSAPSLAAIFSPRYLPRILVTMSVIIDKAKACINASLTALRISMPPTSWAIFMPQTSNAATAPPMKEINNALAASLAPPTAPQ